MISIEWIDAPASTGNSVIGRTQELEVGDLYSVPHVHIIYMELLLTSFLLSDIAWRGGVNHG